MSRRKVLLVCCLLLLCGIVTTVGLMVGCNTGTVPVSRENALVAASQRSSHIPSWVTGYQVDYPFEDERPGSLAEVLSGEKEGYSDPRLPGGDRQVNRGFNTNDQEETSIAVNPNDPNHLVAAWNDPTGLHWGQGVTIGYGWSRDGGKTWQSGLLDFAEFPPEDQMCDPSVAFDGLGNVYVGVLNPGPSTPIPYSEFGIWMAKSTDGGETYGGATRIDACCDKPYVTTNPLNNDVYIVWNDDEEGYVSPESFRIMLSVSHDAGTTWSAPVMVNNADAWGNGPLARSGPAGEIYIVWSNLSPTGSWNDRVYFDRSLDGGTTWLPTDVVVDPTMVGVETPLNGDFRNPNVPSMDVDLSGGAYDGRIYIVAGDQRNGDPDIVLYWSDDRGDTWNGPVRVNDDAVGNGADQWFPWVAVDDTGAVHVSFLDRREDPDNYLYASYLATSTDGGQTFGPNIRVSSGMYSPTGNRFVGDYIGLAVSDTKLYPLWPDGRNEDLDVFTRPVSTTDFDEDGIANDGDGDGRYANHPCTGGQSAGCDDNCPGVPNPDQADSDSDGVGDLCDNCPDTPNADRLDSDRDGFGDACDGCPGHVGGDAGDPDGDTISSCDDNCPDTPNTDQLDNDGDGIGNVCDICPDGDLNDQDGDGLCEGADNCPEHFNPMQRDDDTDGVGDLCDYCPGYSDPLQEDADGDHRGDACDCQPQDPGDRMPYNFVQHMRSFKDGTTAHFAWDRIWYADLHSAVRGLISDLPSGGYGSCFLDGVDESGFGDPDIPPAGDGYFYLVQGQSYDCGMGPLGYDSSEIERISASACTGASFSDHYAVSELTENGSRSGSLSDTTISDDVYEGLTEGPQSMFARLNHTWTFTVSPGSKVYFHIEGYNPESPEGEYFQFLGYGAEGEWFPLNTTLYSPDDPQGDYWKKLPANFTGDVSIRLVDMYVNFGEAQDTAYIDQLWIRTVP